MAIRPGEDVHDDVGIYDGLGVRALGRALNPFVAQAAHLFSNRVYANLLKHTPDHLLVKLYHRLDWAPLETACAAFHYTEGPGAKPTHTVSHLVRALLVGYLHHWSLRELEWQIRARFTDAHEAENTFTNSFAWQCKYRPDMAIECLKLTKRPHMGRCRQDGHGQFVKQFPGTGEPCPNSLQSRCQMVGRLSGVCGRA